MMRYAEGIDGGDIESVGALFAKGEMALPDGTTLVGPGEVTVAQVVADAVVGGAFMVDMRSADGRQHVVTGTYREVVPDRRLVQTWKWDDSDVETLLTVSFEQRVEGVTELTLIHERFREQEACELHRGGWDASLDKLERLHSRA